MFLYDDISHVTKCVYSEAWYENVLVFVFIWHLRGLQDTFFRTRSCSYSDQTPMYIFHALQMVCKLYRYYVIDTGIQFIPDDLLTYSMVQSPS